jgi:hypothetical protein
MHRCFALAVLLLLGVQILTELPSLSEFLHQDHCEEGAAGCLPSECSDKASCGDAPCTCPGCPVPFFSPATLDPLQVLGPLAESLVMHFMMDSPSTFQLAGSVFRPPCS